MRQPGALTTGVKKNPPFSMAKNSSVTRQNVVKAGANHSRNSGYLKTDGNVSNRSLSKKQVPRNNSTTKRADSFSKKQSIKSENKENMKPMVLNQQTYEQFKIISQMLNQLT